MNNSGQIITITLSPCIDKSTEVDKFIPEKKLKCSYPMLEAGGGGINVSRALKNFGAHSICAYIAGGYTGQLFNQMVFHEGLGSFIVDSPLHTRENFIVFEKQTHLQFRFGMPVNDVKEKEWRAIIRFLHQQKNVRYLILSGSISEKISPFFFKELNSFVKQSGCLLIADTSGLALKQVLQTGAYLIKPNLNEFSSLFKTPIKGYKEIVKQGKKIISKNKIKNIIVSLGGDGAILITAEKSILFKTLPLKIKSTVGAGDSMVAGTVFKLNQGHDISESVKFGVACGAATTLTPGTQLCDMASATRMFKKVSSNYL